MISENVKITDARKGAFLSTKIQCFNRYVTNKLPCTSSQQPWTVFRQQLHQRLVDSDMLSCQR